jgi:hypothetical protein
MKTTIVLSGIAGMMQTIRLDRAPLSGADRISINHQVVFEGQLVEDTPYKFDFDNRVYFIRVRKAHKASAVKVIDVEICRNDKLVHVGIYNEEGKLVKSIKHAQSLHFQKTGKRYGSAFGGFLGGLFGSTIAAWLFRGDKKSQK